MSMEPDPTQQTTPAYSEPPPPTESGMHIQGPTNGFAIASLVLGIVGLTAFPFVPSLLALIFGYKARGEIDRSNGYQQGRGLAVAGLVLGWIGVLAGAIGFLIFVIAVVGLGTFQELGP